MIINGEVTRKTGSSVPSVGKSYNRAKIYYGFLGNYTSENTKKAYLKDLKEFMAFIAEAFGGLNEFEVEHSHIVAFKEYLIKRGGERKRNYSQRTINRKLACLGAFYEYLFQNGLIEKNPTARVRRYQIKKDIVTTDLTNEQVRSLLGSIDTKNGSGLLHKAIICVLFNTGMRHGELTNLKFKNLVYENAYVVFKYLGKGEKEMITPLNDSVLADLGNYLDWCKGKGYSMGEEDWIFRPTKNPKDGDLNKKLDPKSLDYIIKKYCKKIGIMGNVTVHSARSTVIGMLLDQGMSIDKVADFVGHRDISTTKAYNKRKTGIGESPAFSIEF